MSAEGSIAEISASLEEIASRLRKVELEAARSALLHYFQDSMGGPEKDAIIDRIAEIQCLLTGRPLLPRK